MTISLCGRAAATVSALLLLLGATSTPQKTSPPAARSTVSPGVVSSDTLRAGVDAGDALVFVLPDASYAIRRAPALTWLIQRTFMWSTMPADTGRHEILLDREAGGTLDTLVLIVTVE